MGVDNSNNNNVFSLASYLPLKKFLLVVGQPVPREEIHELSVDAKKAAITSM